MLKKLSYKTVSLELFEKTKPALEANLFGIDSHHELKKVERELSSIRQTELLENTTTILGLSEPEEIYSFKTLCRIHHQLFRDIYPWAGKVRTYHIAYEGHTFTVADKLIFYAEQVFDDFKKKVEHGFEDRADFVESSARFLNLVNTLHPFPNGNGRSQRNLLLLHFKIHGFYLHWDKIHAWEIYETLKQSFEQNHAPLIALIDKHLDMIERFE